MTKVATGRLSTCSRCRSRKYCAGCEQVIRYGEPRGHDSWPSRLVLDQETTDLLLVAAAEFLELHRLFVERARRYNLPIPAMPTAVDFVDWASTSAGPTVDDKLAGRPGHPFELPQAGRMAQREDPAA